MYDDPKKGIAELNAQYFVVSIKGKVRVGKIGPDGLELMTERDFKLREANKQCVVRGPQNGTKVVSIADAWLKYPGRNQFDGVALVPGGPEVLPNNHRNLYRGWGVQPKEGDWLLMEKHIINVLANGDQDWGNYILWFAAWCVQQKISHSALRKTPLPAPLSPLSTSASTPR
jgi:hypothetical protein